MRQTLLYNREQNIAQSRQFGNSLFHSKYTDFIYEFLGAIQKEWDPESCKIKAKIFKNKYI